MTRRRLAVASAMYAGILIGFWTQVHGSVIATNLGGRIASAFISFAVLLGVLWFFGFGLGQALVRRLQSRTARIAFPGLLAIPYLVFSIPRGEFQTAYALGLAACPMVLAALFEFSDLRPELAWQDALALLAIALLLEMRVFSGAWPYNGLGGLPKLYLADVTLYSYLVVRRLEGVGYSFIPRARDFYTAIREWLFFFPLAMAIGFAVHFIQFYPRRPSLGHVADALLITFLLTAIPEELFFRGVLQNLLEPRMGKAAALILASCLFGLSHFHKVGSTTGAVSAGTLFNWRYVILAAIAGVFYGRAWRARRTLFASALTHTLVDVVWSLWFR